MIKKTIMVVDDELQLLNNIEKMLSELGHDIIVASSGEEAMMISEEYEDQIDLLLTDIVLPSMKGHELAKRLLKKSPNTKVLFMSGYLCPSICKTELDNHTKAFIQKPFFSKDLIKISKKLMDSPIK